MKHLYIIGARGCGREVYSLFTQCKDTMGDIECIGFLDDKKDALADFNGYPPIISSVENYQPRKDDVFICALGDPKWIKHYTQIIENKGGEFISLISPQAFIGKNSVIGKGCVIYRWSVISSDVEIGNHVYIGVFCDLGHDVKIGNCCHVGPYSFLGGGVELNEDVTVHPRVNILPHKKVCKGAILGASSVVIKNVPANTTVFGIPARKI